MTKCPICLKEYRKTRKDQLFCSDNCRKRLYVFKMFYKHFSRYYYLYGDKIISKRHNTTIIPSPIPFIIEDVKNQFENPDQIKEEKQRLRSWINGG